MFDSSAQSFLPDALVDVIEALEQLPGVGPRTAERYAFHILRSSKADAKQLSQAVASLHDKIKTCPVTYMLMSSNDDLSPLYTDPNRDKQLVALVEEPLDVIAIEKTRTFKGTYHVLGGVVSPIDGIGPEQLNIRALLKRIDEDQVEEVIIATNASVEGESTALYVNKMLGEKYPELKITRLARGLPAGTDLEYADHATLSRALEERQIL